ncbi:general substrate transporter [Naematelia encephala]|uniref:General substrate transporter n=1 Tax=Naematelia encephala TaxID=71784 RepID=A0A1Y2AZB1_9TREE|nr:general substrate transporter [Naematelia encephala]
MKRDAFRAIANNGSDLPWYKNKGLRQLNAGLAAVCMCMALNGYDGTLNSGFQAEKSWKSVVGNPSASALGLLNASYYICGWVTMPIAAFVADRWGRKICVQYTAMTNLIGTAIGCAAGAGGTSGYGMYIASRIIMGSGFSFAICVCPIMLQECPHPRQRTVVAGLFDTVYNIGAFLSSWVVFGCAYLGNNWSWRIPYLIHIPFAVTMSILILFIPESPRWLMRNGREDEARAFLVKFHANGAADDPLVNFQMEEMRFALEQELKYKQGTWKYIFGSKGNRHRVGCAVLIAICQGLSGTGIIAYYYSSILKLVGITDTTTVTGIGAGLTTFTFCCACVGLYLTQHIKRRTHLAIAWSMTICANIALIVSTQQYQKHKSPRAGIASVVFVWIYNGSFWLACGSLFFTYPVEVLSYSMRAKGMMVWGLTNKSLAIFSQYTNPVAIAALGWKWYCFYTAVLVVTGIALYFMIVETKGLTLEE